MKKLILLSIASAVLVSCGKNINPPPVDYNDDDGDQILNYLETSERDKYVSNFQQITAKEASITLRLKSLSGDLKIIESKIEFSKDIRGELTKSVFKNFASFVISHDSNYFSEFATAKVAPTDKKVNSTELALSGGEVEIIFDTEEMNQDNVSVMKKSNGKYEELFSGRVDKKTLRATGISNQLLINDMLSAGEIYFINNSNFSNRKTVYDRTLSEDLKKKTYRLIISTPEETNIYYISTALSIQGFLDLEKIDLSNSLLRETSDFMSLYGDTHSIDDKSYVIPLNFMPASMNSKLQEGMTYALYIAKASEIKNDYFESLKKEIGRSNRIAFEPMQLSFKKKNNKELILDLDIQKSLNTLKKQQRRYTTYTTDIFRSCWINVIEPVGTYFIEANILSPIDLGLSFTIDGRSVKPTQEMNIDKNGKIIKRMIFNQNGENLIARFSAPQLNTKSGCITNGCPSSSDAPDNYADCHLSETTDEASFSVSYQAYIE